MHLKEDLAVGGHRDAVSVGEGQGLVVVEDRVEVLDPYGVHRAIQQQPDMVSCTGQWVVGEGLTAAARCGLHRTVGYVGRANSTTRRTAGADETDIC